MSDSSYCESIRGTTTALTQLILKRVLLAAEAHQKNVSYQSIEMEACIKIVSGCAAGQPNILVTLVCVLNSQVVLFPISAKKFVGSRTCS